MKKVKWVFVLLGVLGLLTAGIMIGKTEWFSSQTTTQDTQVIKTLSKEKQIVLVNLGIADIHNVERQTKWFDSDVAGTKKKKFLKAEFDAKLGIDGKKVSINKKGDNQYEIIVPEFIFIGHSNEKFEVVVEDGEIMSWLTPDIDETEMINDVLNNDAQQEYLEKYDDLLKDATKDFYQNLVLSINPEATLLFVFPEE